MDIIKELEKGFCDVLKIKCLSKGLTAQILTYVLLDFTKGSGNKEVRMRY